MTFKETLNKLFDSGNKHPIRSRCIVLLADCIILWFIYDLELADKPTKFVMSAIICLLMIHKIFQIYKLRSQRAGK
jgi:hypothetical protein